MVIEIDHGRVRLGIECPRDIPIYRAELTPIAAPAEGTPGPTPDQERKSDLERLGRDAESLTLGLHRLTPPDAGRYSRAYVLAQELVRAIRADIAALTPKTEDRT